MRENPFEADNVLAISKEALADMPRETLLLVAANLFAEVSKILQGLAGEHGLNITRREDGQLAYHLHRPDPETGVCHNGTWVMDSGTFSDTVLAGIRDLVTGETPEQRAAPAKKISAA